MKAFHFLNFKALRFFPLGFLLLAAGCYPDKITNPDWQTVQNDEFHFSLEAPLPLKKIQIPARSHKDFLTLVGLTTEFDCQVIAMEAAKGWTLEKVNDKSIADEKKHTTVNKNFKMTSIKPVTVSGLPALWDHGTFESLGDFPKEIDRLVLVRGTTVWMVRVTHDDGNKDYEAWTDRIIKSFKLLPTDGSGQNTPTPINLSPHTAP